MATSFMAPTLGYVVLHESAAKHPVAGSHSPLSVDDQNGGDYPDHAETVQAGFRFYFGVLQKCYMAPNASERGAPLHIALL